MRDVAIVAFAQAPNVRHHGEGNDIELLMPVTRAAVEQTGLDRYDIAFTTAGSNDFLAGQAFSFVRALDAVGAYPCIEDSHLEMDGAWALYEAWVRLQLGDADTALIHALGKTSIGNLDDILPLSLDPYYLTPLGLDPRSVAALQARACLDAGLFTEADMAAVVARSHERAAANPNVEAPPPVGSAAAHLEAPYVASPLRGADGPPVTDGAAAIVLAAGDVARELCQRPAWIRGIDHRTEAHYPGVRDLTDSPSTRLAAEKAGVAAAPVAVAELHAQYSHEELLLRRALGLGDDVDVNPSGGPLVANPIMATGLIRLGEAADRIRRGEAGRAVAHATTGPCLQNNLVCVLEGD